MKRAIAVLLIAITAGCARDKSEPAAELPQQPAPFSSPALSRAESLYFAAEYDSAGRIWRLALATDSVRNDSAAQAHILMWLGMREWRLGNYDSARTIGERSLDLKMRLGRTRELSRSFNSLGLIARDEGRLVEARALFQKAMETARAANDTAGINRGAINLALVLQDLGEFGEAQKGFEMARDAGRGLGDARLEGNALNNLGALLIKMGDPAGAIPSLEEAVRKYKTIEYHTGLQNSLGQLATAYDALGDPQRAFSLLDTASAMAQAQGLKQEQENNLRLMGEFYQTAGDHRRALDYFARARTLSSELGLAQETGVVLRAEARSQLALGRSDLALSRLSEALRAHRAAKAAFEEMTDLLAMSELSSTDISSKHIVSAKRISQRINTASARAEVALSDARLAIRSRSWSRVTTIMNASESDVRQARAGGLWELHALKARAFANQGMLDSAVTSGKMAVAAAERVRNRFATGSLRTTFTSERAAVYAGLVVALLRMDKADEAFEIADAARGRELLEHLSEARADVTRQVTRDLAERERILRQIDELTRLLNEAGRIPQQERGPFEQQRLTAIAQRLAGLESSYETLLTRSANENGVPAALLGARGVESKRLRNALSAQEALIEYMVTPERLLIFVVRRDRLVQLTSEVGEQELSAKVRVARGVAGRRGPAHAQDAAVFRSLHDLLIGPAAGSGALVDIKRLVVVPHGSLTYLPFAALIDGSGKYLSDQFAILHAPSAAALMALRTRTRTPSASSRGVVLAPFPETLPSTRREADEVKRSIPSSRILVGSRASERALREALAKSRVVHVASHGILNRRNPLFSRVELSPPASAVKRVSSDDGRFDLHELFGMTVGSQLVFLSGCETGVGAAWSTDFARGDDFATLAQAFLYSGASEVVATLWRLDDEAAAIFAAGFYRNLRTMPPADALAAAQKEVRRDPRLKAPYYWASYTVSGSGGRLGPGKQWWNPFN